MQVLDIDLDFFLNEVPYCPMEERLGADYAPWAEADVRRFLEGQCGLSRERRVRGRYVTHHHEAFLFWRELVEAGLLSVPFEVVHVDSHSDLGMGDDGYVYLMTELLHRDVRQRVEVAVGSGRMSEGNYLAFAAACRWLRRVVYVANPKARDDLMWLHFKAFDPGTGILQLKPCSSQELKSYFGNGPRKKPRHPVSEPEVPFIRVSGEAFSANDPVDYAVLSHSPQYTPPSSDALVPIIMEYVEAI
jgi:hypothetical protein